MVVRFIMVIWEVAYEADTAATNIVMLYSSFFLREVNKTLSGLQFEKKHRDPFPMAFPKCHLANSGLHLLYPASARGYLGKSLLSARL